MTATTSTASTDSSSISVEPSLFPTAHVDEAMIERLIARAGVPQSGRELHEVRAPMTGELIGRIGNGTTEDIERALEEARFAQADWAGRIFEERSEIFTKFHDLVLERRDQIMDLIQLESGKCRSHAFDEVADAAVVTRYYCYHGWDHIKPKRRRGAIPVFTSTTQYFHPKGVVGVIAPWNYPLSMGITDAIAAMLAGNTVVIKPDSQTPFTLLWAADLLDECGLPKGVLNIVPGPGRQLGAPLIAGVNYMCFTGSTATGRIIAGQCAERLINYSLELGGKNAMIVLDDADIEKAAKGAIRACFSSAGQLCISIERLYVHSSIRDEFVKRFVELVEEMNLAATLGWDADMGSLVSADQLATVTAHVDGAVADGAKVLTGGKARPDIGPLFYEPTVLDGVKNEMTVGCSETFGPVVSIYTFDSESDVIQRANASEYGLNASVWTKDAAKGQRIASQIQAGTVNINDGFMAAWASLDAPMGGFKDSGVGRRHGAEGIVKYTESQTVAEQRWVALGPPGKMTEEAYANQMSKVLGLLRKIPFVR